MERKPRTLECIGMTTIETHHELSSNSQEKLFNFLSDLNNFEQLMPEGKVEKWSSSTEECEFTIKGMARIGLRKESVDPIQLIKITSFGKVPFKFDLDIHLEAKDDKTDVYMIFNGDINPFMKMMVEKPLTNFFNILVSTASELNL